MSYHEIKLRPNDSKFSNYIRAKADWRCEYCARLCKISDTWIYKLEASHYMGRRKESTRFDPENVHALCFTCHKNLGGYTNKETGEYDLWMKKILGEKKYRALIIRGNLPGKRDDFLTSLYIKELIKTL